MQRIIIVANVDASGVSKDLFVQFVDDRCLLDKARDNLTCIIAILGCS